MGIRLSTTVIALFATALAVMPANARDDNVDDVDEESVEEIVVYGETSLIGLRHKIRQAEIDFFDLFSELNTNKEFDVKCFRERPVHTLIPRDVCRAQFVKQAETDEGFAWIMGWPEDPAHTTIARKRKQMLKEMERLVLENPELLQALQEYTSAKEEYESERKKRCEGKIIAC